MKPGEVKVKYLENIPAVPKREMVLTRIGYKKGTTILGEQQLNMIEEGMRLGQLLCNIKGAYGRFAITDRSSVHVHLSNDIVFESESLSNLLCKSDQVILMASTAGKEVTERISQEIKGGDPALGIILDSVASQTADAGLNWLMEFLNNLLGREGKRLTKRRYSPGFGDLPLVYQKVIYEALNLGKLDMKLTGKYMLIPEKSVIAIAGIENSISS
jgi:hypothetical protein